VRRTGALRECVATGVDGGNIRLGTPALPSHLFAIARERSLGGHAIFHSILSSGSMPSIGARAWRAKATLNCRKRGQEVYRVCTRSRTTRPCDSMLPQRLHILMDR
jgi:hypothetical protein